MWRRRVCTAGSARSWRRLARSWRMPTFRSQRRRCTTISSWSPATCGTSSGSRGCVSRQFWWRHGDVGEVRQPRRRRRQHSLPFSRSSRRARARRRTSRCAGLALRHTARARVADDIRFPWTSTIWHWAADTALGTAVGGCLDDELTPKAGPATPGGGAQSVRFTTAGYTSPMCRYLVVHLFPRS
jgi:hypothetical protein